MKRLFLDSQDIKIHRKLILVVQTTMICVWDAADS